MPPGQGGAGAAAAGGRGKRRGNRRKGEGAGQLSKRGSGDARCCSSWWEPHLARVPRRCRRRACTRAQGACRRRPALAAHPPQGLRVVRLKGGCPSVFSRVSSELTALAAAGCECDIVPGVSSALAAPLLAGGRRPQLPLGPARAPPPLGSHGAVSNHPLGERLGAQAHGSTPAAGRCAPAPRLPADRRIRRPPICCHHRPRRGGHGLGPARCDGRPGDPHGRRQPAGHRAAADAARPAAGHAGEEGRWARWWRRPTAEGSQGQ
jgi:hypothetical protein